VELVQSVLSIHPVQPVESVQPTESAQPVESVLSVQPVQPVQPVRPVRPERKEVRLESLEPGSGSHGKEGVLDAPVTLADVMQWVEETPRVYPHRPRQDVQGVQGVQEFSLSIGSINLTVEEPRPAISFVPPPSPPMGNRQPGVGGSGSPASRLGRHYIRVR
jgi:hypothetical protein